MDPASMTLGATVAAMVARAASDTADKTVDGATAALGRLVTRLRGRFADDGDEEGSLALARVEDAPDSPSRTDALARIVDERANAAEAFRSELAGLVDEVRATGVHIESINQTASGCQVVQNAGVVGSEIHVSFGTSPKPPDD